ncbi:hypothetical protein M9458_007145, partial [Cirrhinus mrigala]
MEWVAKFSGSLVLFTLGFAHVAITYPNNDVPHDHESPILDWGELPHHRTELEGKPVSVSGEDPESSPPSPHWVEPNPEPTVDREPMPTRIIEPSQQRSATELEIVPEPEPLGASDQMQEPATVFTTREIAMD